MEPIAPTTILLLVALTLSLTGVVLYIPGALDGDPQAEKKLAIAVVMLFTAFMLLDLFA